MSKIELLIDIPVSKEYGLVKGLVLDAHKFDASIRNDGTPSNQKMDAWVKVNGEGVKILSHEYRLVKPEEVNQ